MSIRVSLLALGACLGALIGATGFAEGAGLSVKDGSAVGDRNGAIRALGAAGYDDREGRRPPPVSIPPLDMGRSENGGPPRGTTGGVRGR